MSVILHRHHRRAMGIVARIDSKNPKRFSSDMNSLHDAEMNNPAKNGGS